MIPVSGAQRDIENSLRDAVLSNLVAEYRYPKSHIAPTADGLVLRSNEGVNYGRVIVCLPGELDNGRARLQTVLLEDPDVGFGLATDGRSQIVLRKNGYQNTLEQIAEIEVYRTTSTGLFKQTSPLGEGAEDLFFELHSILRDVDGTHADAALDEVCKLVFAKMFDEQVGGQGFDSVGYGTSEELAAAIRKLALRASQQFDRSRDVHVGNDVRLKASSAAIAKMVAALERYDLGKSPVDVKGRAFQRVLNPALRAGMGQYFTPEPVVSLAVHMVRPQPGEAILDPFCGSAHFLSASLSAASEAKGAAPVRLVGVEKSSVMVRIAHTELALKGIEDITLECADALMDYSNYRFLREGSFDVVVTNPPFGSLLGPEALARLGKFDLRSNGSSIPVEVLGLERSIQSLRPGGRIAIVLPDGVLANKRSRDVRDWLQKSCKLRGIVSLPVETFAPFGANVKTSLIFARKWFIGEKQEENYRIFLGKVDNIGYDASGRALETDEPSAITQDWQAFVEREGW